MSLEIEKDLRLPCWATSWLQVAQRLKHTDVYAFEAQDTPAMEVPFGFFIKSLQRENHKWYNNDKPSEHGTLEYFEGDARTIKMRAFDELFEILPDTEELLKMRDQISYYAHAKYGNMPESNQPKAIKFLDQLIELKTL